MPARDIPGLNLRAYWALGEAGWKTGMDENMWRLSFMVQARVSGIVEELPIDPENGDRYILVNSGSPFHNHMAVWDVDIWAYISPEHGFIIFNNENSHLLRFNETLGQWVELISPEAIKELYESNDDTNAFTNAEKNKLADIENDATADMSAAEIKAAYESNLNTNAFTDAEKAKLNGLSSSRFLGVYPTLTSLQSAHPAPPEGSFAYVDAGPGADIMSYIWDANTVKYVPQASGNSQETPESIKAKYEANDDTNAFTDAEKAKLEAYDPDAPSLPTGGTTGQFLVKTGSGDGEAGWADVDIPEPEDELPPMTGMGGKVLSVTTGPTPEAVWIDPPESYPDMTGNAGRILAVNAAEDGVEWVDDETGGGGGGIEEAPEDGTAYSRKDGEWVATTIDEISPWGGARVSLSTATPMNTIDTNVPIQFDVEERDTDGLWSSGQPTRFTIPPGVSKVRLACMIAIDPSDAISASNVFIFRKNGKTSFSGRGESVVVAAGYTNPKLTISSDVLDVVEGDYFEIAGYSGATYALSSSTWFAIEIIERSASNAHIAALLDVDADSPVDGQSLVYDASLGKWIAGVPDVTASVSYGTGRPFKGAMAYRTADLTVSAFTVDPVPWQATSYDTNAFWSAGSPGRLTIPAGIKKVRLHGSCKTNNTFAADQFIYAAFKKNGSFDWLGVSTAMFEGGSTGVGITIVSPVVPVVAGDYFEMYINSEDSSYTMNALRSQFSIEVVEEEVTP